MASKEIQELPKVYCDACFFIAIFHEEVGRFQICSQIMEDAREGKCEIITSYCTIIECCKSIQDAEKKLGFTDEKVEEFLLEDAIVKVEVDRIIALKARKIQQHVPKKIKPFDSLHVATAIQEKCDFLFTYDRDHLISMSKHNSVDGMNICAPFRPWDDDIISGQSKMFPEVVGPELRDKSASKRLIEIADNSPTRLSSQGQGDLITEEKSVSSKAVGKNKRGNKEPNSEKQNSNL
jgi:predicted nucleic acid-binding protein